MGSASNKAGARRIRLGDKYLGSRRLEKASGQFGGQAGYAASVYTKSIKHVHPRRLRDHLEIPTRHVSFVKNGSKLHVMEIRKI